MVRLFFLGMLEMIDWGQPFAFKASETCLKPNFIGRYLHAFLHLFCQIRVFFVFISLKISNCFTIALFKRSSNCLMLLKCYDYRLLGKRFSKTFMSLIAFRLSESSKIFVTHGTG